MDGGDSNGDSADDDTIVGVHHASTEQAEASFVARRIEQLLGGASFHSLDSGRVETDGSQGLGFSDFAVLYRTDRQARALVDSFTTTGLPFQKRSHDRLTDRPGVGAILGELGGSSGVSVADRVRRAAQAAAGRMTGDEPDGESPVHTAVELLVPLAERCGDDLDRFRTELALGVEVDTWDPRADRISLLTLHAAKGLEFPVVFVVGCEDGLLPLQWPGAAPSDGEVDEERRLLFVGMTRARRQLYLTHAAERAWPGAARKATRSRFLADLDSAAYEQIGDAVPRPRPRTSQLRLL
jgi:superfamily I DNA/RNA helicase